MMGPEGEAAAAQLRGLAFAAEQGFAAALAGAPRGADGADSPVAAAQSSLLQLQSLLSVTAGGGAASRQQAAGLLQQCTSRLLRLSVQHHRSEGR